VECLPLVINADPRPVQLAEGLQPLRHVVDMLPDLRVIVFFGGSASDAARFRSDTYPTRRTKSKEP